MSETNGKKLKAEIEKRTRDTSRLIEIETKKLAVGEMVLERLETILDLLNAAGFKVVRVTTQSPTVAAQPVAAQPSIPPHVVVVQDRAAPAPPLAAVQRPCTVCGQEAAFSEPMGDGTQKLYCRPHGQARMREKQEEAVANDLFHGQTGTMFVRPPNPNAATPQKTIIQSAPAPPPPPPGQSAADMLKGPFNNGEPPHNPVLDE